MSSFLYLVITLVLLASVLTPGVAQTAPPQVEVGIDVTGGVYHMFTVGVDKPTLHLTAEGGSGAASTLRVALTAVDIFGRPVNWKQDAAITLPADGSAASVDIGPIDLGPGFFQINAHFTGEGVDSNKHVEFGVIPPPHPGLRPDSFFASNTSGFKTGDDLAFLQKIGMKICRQHFIPGVATAPTQSTGAALSLDFTQQDAQLADLRSAGLSVLPIVGYSFPGTNSQLANELGMYGPPRDNSEFVNTWQLILQHHPDITTWEFWNEPWVFGWNFAGTGQQYRDLQKQWCEMALKVNPKLRIIAGNSSMFVEDHIEPFPDSWKGLLSGTTHHPYTFSCGAPVLRAGDQTRAIDYGMQVTRRMGLPYYYLTEGGEQYQMVLGADAVELRHQIRDVRAQVTALPADQRRTPAAKDLHKQMRDLTAKLDALGDPNDNNQNAYKVVQYYLHTAIVGAYMGNAQWEIGYGPTWTRSNTSFAVMTNMLEDRPVVADIWPSQELIWGAIFANPKFATAAVRELPRGSELGERWPVAIPADRQADTTKVAVIWSETGQSNDNVDTGGTLTIDNPAGLSAFDLTGRPILPSGGKLVLPFTEYPVYVTSDSLDVIGLRSRIAEATIAHVTPVNLYAFSLTQPASQAQTLGVRVENQVNVPLSGTLTLSIAGKTISTSPFTIDAGKLAEVGVPWPGVALSTQNQYLVGLTATTPMGSVTRSQMLASARFVKRTITVDGDLSDWKGVTPVLIDSNELANGVDISQYMLNPNLSQPAGTPDSKRIVARVYTAYDDNNVYIAAAVNQATFTCNAGNPVVKGRKEAKVTLPFLSGEPDGLNHIRNEGDVLMFAFGFRDRYPGYGRQMDDPYAWKGQFFDTDYVYSAHTSVQGDQLIREWGANTTRETAYQTEKVPFVGPIPGAKIKIVRNDAAQLTVYEISIPRTELKLFDPTQPRLRFNFMLANSEKLGDSGALEWSQAAGVFDHWRSAGSYTPSWMQVPPAETVFGIER